MLYKKAFLEGGTEKRGWLKQPLPESPQFCLLGDKYLLSPGLREADLGLTVSCFIVQPGSFGTNGSARIVSKCLAYIKSGTVGTV